MNIDELNAEYAIDSKIDQLNLEDEARRALLLHAKYIKLWTEQRYKSIKYSNELKQLKIEKFEHYSQGASKETKSKGWKLPAVGMILKQNIPLYMDGDEHILEVQNKIDEAQVLIDALEKMVQTLSFRGNLLNFILSNRKYEAGC